MDLADSEEEADEAAEAAGAAAAAGAEPEAGTEAGAALDEVALFFFDPAAEPKNEENIPFLAMPACCEGCEGWD